MEKSLEKFLKPFLEESVKIFLENNHVRATVGFTDVSLSHCHFNQIEENSDFRDHVVKKETRLYKQTYPKRNRPKIINQNWFISPPVAKISWPISRMNM